MPIPNRTTFQDLYSGKAPWDIGKPQEAFIQVSDQVSGKILDAGCGTGENALFFAQQGCHVTGIDFLAEPIAQAKQKAAERGLTVSFLVMNALSLTDLPEVFDGVIDCGLFHVFSDEDRVRYVAGLASVLRPGGKLFLMCFSDDEPGEHGPRRVSRIELEKVFAEGWQIKSLEPALFEVRPDITGFTFSPGGPKAWFLTAKRAN